MKTARASKKPVKAKAKKTATSAKAPAKKTKSVSKTSAVNSLDVVPILNCSFIVPTEDKKGVYLIIDEKSRESVFQVDGLGSEFCRRIDGSRSGEEIAQEIIETHNLPSEEFKEYLIALQKDLQANGLLSFQRS